MSEYWKSVPRKFCEFCKCWITDNKPSVDFHERGKRHQENVQLRLKEVRKRSLQQSREDDQVKAQMEQMEKAALEAFKKDLKDNPALAAQYGVSLEPKPKPEDQAESSAAPSTEEDGEGEKKKKKKRKKKEWYEAESPEGYKYYWSTVTGESKWEAPEEFVSLEEQKAEESGESTSSGSKESKSLAKKSKTKTSQEKPAQSTPEENNKKEDPASEPTKSAFGGWEVVREVERPKIYDETSAAPALEEIPLPEPETKTDESEVKKPKVKEKVVTLGPSSGGPVAFKKRKIGGARNVRQKADDD